VTAGLTAGGRRDVIRADSGGRGRVGAGPVQAITTGTPQVIWTGNMGSPGGYRAGN